MGKYKTSPKRKPYNEFMTSQELAHYLGFSRRTIYEKTVNEEIPAVKIFGSWRFRKSDIDKWIKSCSNYKREKEKKWKRKRKS